MERIRKKEERVFFTKYKYNVNEMGYYVLHFERDGKKCV